MAPLEIRISTMKIKAKKSKLDGEGLFAETFIPAGDRILSERCIFSGYFSNESLSSDRPNRIQLLPTFRELDDQELDRIMHHCKRVCPSRANQLTRQAFVNSSEAAISALEQTFSPLCFPFVKDAHNTKVIRLFNQTTYLNHSCLPNAEASWNDGLGKLLVYAVRDIKQGEEITISYVPLPFERKGRRARDLGFSCKCDICRGDSYEKKFESLGHNLEHIRAFRARFFDANDFDVDFRDGDKMLGQALAIFKIFERAEEDATALMAATDSAFKIMAEDDLVHSSLAVAFETVYIVHAALFIIGQAKQMYCLQENVDTRSVASSGGNGEQVADRGLAEESSTNDNPDEIETLQEQMVKAASPNDSERSTGAPPADGQSQDNGISDISDEDLQTHFDSAFEAKLNEIAVLLRCLGVENARVRKAVTHAWHMAEGNRNLELTLQQRLAGLGVRLRRTWTEEGDIMLEIAKFGRPPISARAGRSG